MIALTPLPSQPAQTPWPTSVWPGGELDQPRARWLSQRADYAFSEEGVQSIGETLALAVIQGGRLVFERYGESVDATTTLPSWSKAKSVTHALTGVLVGLGRLDVHAPANVPEWRSPGDPRSEITLDQLLRMSSGLRFNEIYLPDQGSDVIEMLFGSGKADVAAFAASLPLSTAPDTWFAYSSGSTNIVSRVLSQTLDLDRSGFERFMRQSLFEKIGMSSASPKFDEAGTFIGSSFCYATAQDFARFGLLYLRDGIWEDVRLLPEGWVDYARTPTRQQPGCEDGPYGAHWWLGVGGPGSFSANGYEGQFTVVIPDLDMVVVRHGKSPLEAKDLLSAWMSELIDGFRR